MSDETKGDALCSFNHISLFSFIWLQHSGKRYKYGTKIKAESLVQRVRKPCIYFDLWVQLLTAFLFLKRRNLIHSIFKPNKNADLYQKCTCLKLFLFWEKKKRDDPVSSAVPWGSAETETGLKGLAACVGGGPLWYVLDLFKGNRAGGEEMPAASSWITWLLFVFRMFCLKKQLWESKKKQAVG